MEAPVYLDLATTPVNAVWDLLEKNVTMVSQTFCFINKTRFIQNKHVWYDITNHEP